MTRRRSIRFQLLCLVAAIAIPLVGLQIVVGYEQYRLTVTEAQSRVTHVTQAVGAGVLQFTTLAEAQMLGLADVLAREGLDPALCRAMAPGLRDVLQFVTAVTVVDADGEFVCSTLPLPLPGAWAEHVRDRAWYRRMLETDGFVFGPPMEGMLSGAYITVMAAPVVDEDGRRIGAVAAGIDLVRFDSLLARVNVPPEALVTIADADGRILARSAEPTEYVGATVPPDTYPQIALDDRISVATGPDLSGVERTWSNLRLPNNGWRVYVGMPMDLIVGPARAALLRRTLAGLFIGGIGFILALWFYQRLTRSIESLAEGSEMAGAGRPVTVPDSAPSEVVAVAERLNWSLEARGRAEASERKAQEHFLSIFENAAFGICLATDSGRFLEVNPALVSILGHDSKAELMARDAEDLYFEPENRTALRKSVAEDGTYRDMTVEWRRKDGSGVTVRLNGRAMDTQEGLVYVTIVEDITGERALEEQLRQTQKMEAVGQLAGGVAHDFNNLLTVIIGHARMLLERPRPDEDLADARQILAASERAAALTQQLLAFSRRKVSQPRSVHVSQVIGNLEKMLSRLIGEDIELVTDLAPDVGPVLADPVELEQVVVNLVVNARDAMPDGGRIVVKTEHCTVTAGSPAEVSGADPGEYVRLTVSDTGAGMDEETRSRAFEPFFTTKPVGKGTGLGLSTVYGIVRQSGGTVSVESAEGRGTTFEILIPLARTQPEPDRPQERIRPAPGHGLTVLVVEDEDDVRGIVARVLSRAGYRVLQAADPAEALELAARFDGDIDLLVTDMVMPVMKGVELADRLLKTRPAMPVLFISGYTDGALAQARIQEDPKGFLSKPFGPVELLTRVDELIGRGAKVPTGRS